MSSDPAPRDGGESQGTPAPSAALIDGAGQTSAGDDRVEQLLAGELDIPALATAVQQQQAADAADTLERLEGSDAAALLERMELNAAAAALSEMQRPLAVGVVEDLIEDQSAYAARLLEIMAPDDGADILQGLDEEDAEHLLESMTTERAAELRRLMGYDEESAGGLMTTEFIALRAKMSVKRAIETIRARRPPESLDPLPVVGPDSRLVGVVRLRNLLLARPEDRVASLVEPTARVVPVNMDREEVAREFDRYDHSSVPVVDEQNRLVGVVTVDDVIDIIRAEQTEDVQRTVGAGAGEAVYSGVLEKLRGRFPWLGVSLVMSGAAAAVVLMFEGLIAERPILAFLMPVIAALVGNAGHQALAVTLRGVVLGEVSRERVMPLIGREVVVGVLNGIALGLLMLCGLSVMSQFFDGAGWPIGLVAGAATAAAMTVGTLSGSCVPLLMRKFGVDPAHASAIFLIMITDAVSFSFLLGLTKVLFG